MASFEQHIKQAKNNLSFLKNINSNVGACNDWQVTCCFYIAVHLVNAHIAKTMGLHYRTHKDVNLAINPENMTSIGKVSEDCYADYKKLYNLSRISRYLVNNEKHEREDNEAQFIKEKHFVKAIRCLDKIMKYFDELYDIKFDTINLLPGALGITDSFKYFSVKISTAIKSSL